MRKKHAACLDLFFYSILKLLPVFVVMFPFQTTAATLAEQCNAAAGSPYGPENPGTGRGVDLRDIDWGLFVSSCPALYRSNELKSPKDLYRFARGYYGRLLNGNTCRDVGGFEKVYSETAERGYAPAARACPSEGHSSGAMALSQAAPKR
jgi:hypothetical protein